MPGNHQIHLGEARWAPRNASKQARDGLTCDLDSDGSVDQWALAVQSAHVTGIEDNLAAQDPDCHEH